MSPLARAAPDAYKGEVVQLGATWIRRRLQGRESHAEVPVGLVKQPDCIYLQTISNTPSQRKLVRRSAGLLPRGRA